MINITKCIVGFTLLAIKFEKNVKSIDAISGCDVESNHGRLVANCSSKQLERIPQNLDSKIEILDVSHNPALVLRPTDLKNYPNLFGFVLRNVTIRSFPDQFFKPLSNLKMLNVSNATLSADSLNTIPSTIRILNFTDCMVESVYISHLKSIEEIFLKNCEMLNNFPSVSKHAPLKVLDMRYCPLGYVNYSHLAPFCQLRYFGFFSPLLNQSKHAVRCCGLREWGRLKKIKGMNNMACYKNRTHLSCSNFNITFSEESLKEYAACVSRRGTKWFLQYLIYLAIALIVIALIIAGVVFFYYRLHKREIARKASSTYAIEEKSESTVNPETKTSSEFNETIYDEG